MFSIVHNDSFSDLTLLDDLNNNDLIIINSDFKVYDRLGYDPFEPSKKQLLDMWTKALRDHYALDKEDTPLKEWREMMTRKSIRLFKESDIYKRTESEEQ